MILGGPTDDYAPVVLRVNWRLPAACGRGLRCPWAQHRSECLCEVAILRSPRSKSGAEMPRTKNPASVACEDPRISIGFTMLGNAGKVTVWVDKAASRYNSSRSLKRLHPDATSTDDIKFAFRLTQLRLSFDANGGIDDVRPLARLSRQNASIDLRARRTDLG